MPADTALPPHHLNLDGTCPEPKINRLEGQGKNAESKE
jgi:hypothetical protein